MDLVLNVEDFQIEGAFFEGDSFQHFFKIAPDTNALDTIISRQTAENVMICSSNEEISNKIKNFLDKRVVSCSLFNMKALSLIFDIEEPNAIEQSQIANCYGALHHFSQSNCIVVDLGAIITFDAVTSDGIYQGGASYPGMSISTKALNQYNPKFPLANIEKPEISVTKTVQTYVQSGIYYGLLGAIERITFEMRQSYPSPSDVKVLATGKIFQDPIGEELSQDLEDLVDLIDPKLTFVGIHEIMKEDSKHVR